MRSFYYAINREQHGPVPLAALSELFSSGAITGDTLVWSDSGMESWKKLSEANVLPPSAARPEPPQPAANVAASPRAPYTQAIVDVAGPPPPFAPSPGRRRPPCPLRCATNQLPPLPPCPSPSCRQE